MIKKIRRAYDLLDQTDQMIKNVRSDLISLKKDMRFGTMSSADVKKRIEKIERRLDLWDGIK